MNEIEELAWKQTIDMVRCIQGTSSINYATALEIASRLYSEGYRKIPDLTVLDSVELTRIILKETNGMRGYMLPEEAAQAQLAHTKKQLGVE